MSRMWSDEELIDIEQRKLERQDALEHWIELRDAILHEGGVARVTEDYKEIPMCLRRSTGLSIDVMADLFGYSYIDEFVQEIDSVYRRYQRTSQTRIERVPFHYDRPDLQETLDQLYELFRTCLQVKAFYGSRQHPACVDLYEAQRQSRRAYVAACDAAHVEPAHV